MLKIKCLTCVLSIALVGCSEQPVHDVPTVHFDLSSARQMNMSEFVDSITLIPLETNDSSLIRKVRSLNIVGDTLFIRDGGRLVSFNDKGGYLFSTNQLQGPGAKDYYSAVSFSILPNNDIEVFDAMNYKMITYDKDLHYVLHRNLPNDVLPATGCLYISEDYRLIVDKSLLKLYSIHDEKIVNTYEVLSIPHFSYFHMNGFNKINNRFLVSTKNDNVIYEMFIDDLNIRFKPICKFDFGDDANFCLFDLPKGENEKFYLNYSRDNHRDVFISDKYVDDEKQMCFFTYDNKSYFAYHNEALGTNCVYYNVPMSKQQFIPANFYMNNTFYYVCEVQYLDYVIDRSLMSTNELSKMKSIREDDNPIIVCYKLK